VSFCTQPAAAGLAPGRPDEGVWAYVGIAAIEIVPECAAFERRTAKSLMSQYLESTKGILFQPSVPWIDNVPRLSVAG
jgi:hypothetical protein